MASKKLNSGTISAENKHMRYQGKRMLNIFMVPNVLSKAAGAESVVLRLRVQVLRVEVLRVRVMTV